MRHAATVLVLTGILPAAAGAQSRPGHSFDAGLGVATVHRGTYKQQAGPALTMQWALVRRSGFVSGVAAGWQAGVPTGDDCRPDGSDGCLQTLPSAGAVTVLAGREFALGSSAGRWTIRPTAGPGLTRAGTDSYGDTRTVGGMHGRVDLASPGRRIAAVMSLHAAYIPALPRGGRGTRGVTLGIRFP